MQFLIITADFKIQQQVTAFIVRHFGDTSIILKALTLSVAKQLIVQHCPEIILANTRVAGKSMFKLIEHLPQSEFSNFFFINNDAQNAISAIRMGVKGMFNFPAEQALMLKAIEKLTDNTTIKKLESQLKNISIEKSQQKSIFVQSDTGFVEIDYSNLLYVKGDNNRIYYGVKGSMPIKSNHELFLVANNLPNQYFSVVTPKLIINTANILRIQPEKSGCRIQFDDSCSIQVPDMGLDMLFRIIKEANVIQS